jgi:4-carboxymuconolactone decarboxylase
MSANSDFGTFGRYKELSLEEMTAEQRKAYDFSLQQRGQVPGPYKIWLQNPKPRPAAGRSELAANLT